MYIATDMPLYLTGNTSKASLHTEVDTACIAASSNLDTALVVAIVNVT